MSGRGAECDRRAAVIQALRTGNPGGRQRVPAGPTEHCVAHGKAYAGTAGW